MGKKRERHLPGVSFGGVDGGMFMLKASHVNT